MNATKIFLFKNNFLKLRPKRSLKKHDFKSFVSILLRNYFNKLRNLSKLSVKRTTLAEAEWGV